MRGRSFLRAQHQKDGPCHRARESEMPRLEMSQGSQVCNLQSLTAHRDDNYFGRAQGDAKSRGDRWLRGLRRIGNLGRIDNKDNKNE